MRARPPARRRGLRAAVVGLAAAILLGLGLPPALADTFSSPATGTHSVTGPVLDRYRALGGPAGVLGYPTTDQVTTPDGRGVFNHFQGGSVYWSAATGAHQVGGAIRDTWARWGWENGVLGFPVTDEVVTPGGLGRFNHFQGGSVYWSAAGGAHQVGGAIRDTWARLGWERGVLGFPVTDEVVTPNRLGRYNHFQGGSVYSSAASGAHQVGGSIREKWAQLGWENGVLGFPTTDELPTGNGQGRFNHFQGGSVYWSPATGAHQVGGSIREKWAQLGWENSALGFPTSDEYAIDGGRAEDFQYGTIRWTPTSGAVVVGAPRAGGGTLPLGVTPPGSQAITVVASSPGATTATLTAWQRGVNGWTVALGPVTARVGGGGIGVASEYTTRTPAGTWRLTEGFGRLANPGAMPYRVIDGSDWWVSDVRSPRYNRYARCAPRTCDFDEAAGENLWSAGTVYDNAMVIDYNRTGVPGAGSAFFLHVSNGAPTAGCVAVPRADVQALLRWLSPGATPVISIGVG